MIEMMLSEVPSRCDELPQQYLVYAMRDGAGRCCYVGMTRVARRRMEQHLARLTNVKTVLDTRGDIQVAFYDKCDVDSLFKAAAPLQSVPDVPVDKAWAESAEWFLCEEFHPYLNIRKGWPGELARAKDFIRSEGLGGCVSLADVARSTLKIWNPPFNHDAIVDAYVAGADISGLAKVAGIEFGSSDNQD